MIQELDGVVLNTAQLDAMVEFYTKVLGLKLEKKGKGGALLVTGGGQSVVLEQVAEAVGFRSFVTFRVDDAAKAHKELEKRGAKFSSGPKDDELGLGAKVFSTNDPDGNRVGFVQRG